MAEYSTKQFNHVNQVLMHLNNSTFPNNNMNFYNRQKGNYMTFGGRTAIAIDENVEMLFIPIVK